VAAYDGQEHTVSFVHTKDGTSVLMDTQDVYSTPDVASVVPVFAGDGAADGGREIARMWLLLVSPRL